MNTPPPSISRSRRREISASCYADAVRVALDCKLETGPPGGVARYLFGLRRGLGTFAPEAVQWVRLVPSRGRSTLRWTLWELQRASGRGFDVLHCPFYYTPLAPRCPATVAVHDVLVLEHPEWFPRAWANPIRWLMPVTARRAAAVVTDAMAVAERIEALCRVPRERIRVIPHAVDHGVFRPPGGAAAAAAAERWTGGRPYVLQVGALEPRRGVDLAVRAVAAIRVDQPDLVLVLAGGERAPVPGLESAPDWVIRTGWVEDGDLPALYAGAEAVLSPSRGEGFDLPLLEALACGAAVVASDIPVHVEHFAPAVRLFPSGDWEALAGELLRVLEDEELRQTLKTRAVGHARGFTWERSAREHLALWREIVGP